MKRHELGARLQESVEAHWERLDDTGKMPTRKQFEELLGLALEAAAVLQKPKRRFGRSAITGRFASSAEVEANPDTTTRERT